MRDCWDDLAVVDVDCGDEWAVAVVAVLQEDFVERRCLMKCQEEERAFWVLNLGWEGEEGWDKGETLRFFEG